jgi:hypothetical protein
VVRVDRISPPLGPMLAAATDEALCLLEFVDRRALPTQIARIYKDPGPCSFLAAMSSLTARRTKSFRISTDLCGTSLSQPRPRELTFSRTFGVRFVRSRTGRPVAKVNWLPRSGDLLQSELWGGLMT